MIYTEQEKKEILGELVTMAYIDGFIKKEEVFFILALGSRLGIAEKDIQELINNPEDIQLTVPTTQTKRIVHFHRLMIITYIDGVVSDEELQFLYELALRYNISRNTVNTLLKVMEQYPHGEIPAKELIDIHLRDNN